MIAIQLGSLLIGIVINAITIKLAAGWLKAEHPTWGRSFAAVFLIYVASAIIGVAGALAAASSPDIGIILAMLAIPLMLIAAIWIVANRLGTSMLRGFGILLLAFVINLVLWAAIGVVLALVMGAGIAGLMAYVMGMMGQAEAPTPQDGVFISPPPGSGGVVVEQPVGDPLARAEAGIERLCKCRSSFCVDEVFATLAEDVGAASESPGVIEGDPSALARFEAVLVQMEVCQDGAPDGAAIAAAGAADGGNGEDGETQDVIAESAMDDAAPEDTDLSSPEPADVVTEAPGAEPAAVGDTVDAAIDDAAANAAEAIEAAVVTADAGPDPAADVATDDEAADSMETVDTVAEVTQAADAVSTAPARTSVARRAPDVVPPPVRATTTRRKPAGPVRYYRLRVIDPGEAVHHVGRLLRMTRADGSRFTDQLVDVDGNNLVLRRSRTAGGTQYVVRAPDLILIEVFAP